MHLLGLQLLEGDKSIVKNLQPKWYPFCNVKSLRVPPTNNNIDFDVNDSFYRLDRDSDYNISISCIVGKNGTGKSTLLDIIYRTLNNLAWHIKKSNEGITCDLIYANGFHSKLFFEVNKKVGYIEINSISQNDKNHEKDFICWEIGKPPKNLCSFNIEKLSDFFYSIVTNYSIYAFNPDDYIYDIGKKYKEKPFYVNGIFNKNDAYISPLAMIPYRNNKGIINTENERKLAIQRIIALTIFLAKKYNKSLIENRVPIRITYSLNTDYKKQHPLRGEEEYKGKIYSAWKEYYEKESNINEFPNEIIELIYYYLIKKTYKLITRYGILNKNSEMTNEQKEKQLLSFSERDIEIILNDSSFESLKIRQVNHFIMNPFKYFDDGFIDIDDKRFIIDEDQEKITVDDYFLRVPPPFYNYDLEFSSSPEDKENTFSLSKMSSGEKQILFNFSYILYHLKNIDSKSSENSQNKMNATPPYRNVVLFFDEAEIYLHPEYQRRYIFLLLEAIKNCQFEKIKNFHIIFATHSPYLLSDVLNENILLLHHDKDNEKENYCFNQSFCANIYDLLNNQFFIDAPIGEFGRFKIEQISSTLADRKNKKNEIDLEFILKFRDSLGDEYTRKIITYLLKNRGFKEE